MPKSEIRKKKVYTPPSDMVVPTSTSDKRPSPMWLPATAVSLIVVGIGWLVVYYLSETTLPVQAWGYWNLAVGFGAMVTALGLLSKWK